MAGGIAEIQGIAGRVKGEATCSAIWHVLHVKSRQEKILADDLAAMKIEFYLPLIRQVRYWGSRKNNVETPLFPGYVFLHGTLDEAYRADRTNRVAGVIEVFDQQQLDWELRNLRMALDHRVILDPYPFLRNGTRVEVRSGPLRGLQGIVQDHLRDHRLALQVKLLGRAVSLEIDGALLEPMD